MIDGSDLKCARLLAGLTAEQLGVAMGLHPQTLRRIENGRRDAFETQAAMGAFLEGLGIRFGERGYITALDGRVAPTVKAVGVLNGDRIRKARYRLAWTLERLAGESGYSVDSMRRLEGGKRLNASPDLPLYKAIGALQLAGSVFAPTRQGTKRGDYCLVPRPRSHDESRRPIRDYARAAVTRPLGPRGLEFEED